MISYLFCDVCGAALPTQATCCPVCGQVQQAPSRSSSSHTATQPGALLTQRYRIIEKIGEGGFGVVYKARDRKTGDFVAIKQITLAALSAREIIDTTDSYNREITLLPKLRHKSLPLVYAHFTDPEHWYIVTEYINGKTLAETLTKTRGGRLPLKNVLDIGKKLCDVLGYLHNQQPPIIFRDVKPDNIMITNRGDVYLIDFGIARRYRPEQSKDTGQLGSPGYAAPEQYRKTQTTPQTDMYGLGATLQTLLTGKEPLEIQMHGIPPECKIPKEVQTLISHMMEYDASRRPANREDVGQVLQGFIERFASKKKSASKPESPFLWLIMLWLLFVNVIICTLYQMPLLALLFLPIVAIYIHTLYKEKRKITGKLTIKGVGAILNKNIAASRFIFLAILWTYNGVFAVFHRSSSSFQLPIYMLIIGLYIVQFVGAFAILVGLQPLLTWLQKIKAARQSQPPMQTEIAPLQQQSRKNSI